MEIPSPEQNESRVLSDAVTRIASRWKFSDELFGQVLGIPADRAAKLRTGEIQLVRADDAFRAGQYLVRLYQDLSTLLGDDLPVTAWLEAQNSDLGDRPIERIRTAPGLREVSEYVGGWQNRA
jgi:hypothetical protein